MSSFLGVSANSVRDRLRMTEDAVNSTRLNMSANGVGSLGSRGSGGTSVFTPVSRLVPSAAATHAYKGSDASTGSTPRVYVQIGSHNSIVPTIDGTALSAALTANILTLGTSDKLVYVELDVMSGSISTAEIYSSASTGPPADSISGGTGQSYQTLFFTSISTTGGTASVSCSDNVSGSQAFQVCNNTALYGLV